MTEDLSDRVRPMTSDDLDQVRSWRNHPLVRSKMYSQHEVSEDEHHRWFAKVSQENGRHLLIFEVGLQACGFVQFTSRDGTRVAEWGFYTSPDAPKGMGRRMGRAALAHVFGPLGFHKVCGQALGHNEASIRFHKALGFREEGILREQHFDGQAFHNVHCFGLLAPEWRGII